jgi:hypothetical protein
MVNADDLPQEIIQPLAHPGRALLAHTQAHGDTSLAEHEDGVLAAWRTVAPVLREGGVSGATFSLRRYAASKCDGEAVDAARQNRRRSRVGGVPARLVLARP